MSEKVEEIPSGTGGVKPIPIEGIWARERSRLAGRGMTDEERKMRAQWIKDQELAANEPIYVPAMDKELMNPIRRFYRWPLDRFFEPLMPKMRPDVGPVARLLAGKFIMGWFAVYGIIYYFKYNKNDWTRERGWRVQESKVRVLPGDPGFPKASTMMTPHDYNDRGFKNSPI